MKMLLHSLKEADNALLPGMAKFWGVDITQLDQSEIPAALENAMMQTERTERIWEKLDDEQRGVLQTLLGGINAGKMALPMFERFYGEIRKMGKGAIERENPLERPASTAEGLYYRGLIYEGYEQTQTGGRAVIYIPPDFAAVLPSHITTYDDLEAEVEELSNRQFLDPSEVEISEIEPEFIEEMIAADTSIVDDLTTLLAYLQINSAEVTEQGLADQDVDIILAHCIHQDYDRISFIFEIAISSLLVEVQNGRAHPRRAETRRWLEQRRSEQLKALVNAWLNSTIYRDLWHITGLHPEPTGWPYDPVVARKAAASFIRDHAPIQAWWSIDEFILTVKDINPDFQRPGGDYDSWYIRNDAGEYLNGFESWDAVEGALLEFYLFGPMHWLGLADLGEDAVHLNAYGRAFITQTNWPDPPDDPDPIIVEADGILLVSRRVPRFERFQAMRFTTWESAAQDDAPYQYRLSAEGVQRAAQQGITTEHISAFVIRMLGDKPVPPTIQRLLETWQSGPVGGATIENLTVLRTTSIETMDYIVETPALRRYLGGRLGPMAVIVLRGEWENLRDALGAEGIDVEIYE